MDSDARHLTLITARDTSQNTGGVDAGSVSGDSEHAQRHPLGSRQNLALAGCRQHTPFPDYPWGSQDPFGRLSQVGRAAMEQAEAARIQAGSSAEAELYDAVVSGDCARIAVALHPFGRGSVEREHRQRILRGLADDASVGAGSVLRLPRRSTSTLGADAEGRARLSRERLLDRLARGTVAKYVSAVSRLRVGGPVRFW